MAQFRTESPVFTGKANPAGFLECHAETFQSSASIDLKVNSTKVVGTTVSGLGFFVPSYLLLVAVTIAGLTVQPIVTFMGSSYACAMTAANNYNFFNLEVITNIPAIDINTNVSFTMDTVATATTYDVRAYVGGMYTRI